MDNDPEQYNTNDVYWNQHIRDLCDDIRKNQWMNVLAHLNRMQRQALMSFNDQLKSRGDR